MMIVTANIFSLPPTQQARLVTRKSLSTMSLILLIGCAASVSISAFSAVPAIAVGPASEDAIRNAWALYTKQNYGPSADAFEALIRTSTPSSRLYYYASAASKAANRAVRAKQLAEYISKNFPTSAEAGYVQKLFPELAPAAPSQPVGLPAHLKGLSVDQLMQTEEGRRALQEAVTTSSAASAPASGRTAGGARGGAAKPIERPKDAAFTADIIAVEGPSGITTFMRYPNAAFECSLAAMALLPRGRELLAATIRCPSSQDIYMVRFPNSANEYSITTAKMEKSAMKDRALWAAIIHAALREAPVHDAEGGLGLLTGNRTEKMLANNTTQQALSTFIGEAVRRQHPIICLSIDDQPEPSLVEAATGFTITDFDAATGMVTLRNPHGSNSQRFRLEDDPQHKKFQQMADGVFKLNLSQFPKYIGIIVRSAI